MRYKHSKLNICHMISVILAVLMMVVREVARLFDLVKALFHL